MQETQIASRNLDAIPGSSSEQKSDRDIPRIDILKELNEENEVKSTPRLRLLQEDDIISDRLAISPVQTISSRTPSPSLMAKRLSANASRISKKAVLLKSPDLSSTKSPNDKRKGFFRKATEAKKISKLRSSLTKEIPEDSYDDTAELHDIQHLFHHYDDPSMKKNGGEETKKHLFAGLSNIQEAYYNTLRKKMVRRKSQKLEEPVEFLDQIKEIKGSVRTPNEMRSRDIVIIDKTNMERIIDYHDNYPLLEFRKKVLKFLQWISILCYKIITFPAFDYAILAVVLTNSILLAMDDPTDNVPAISTGLDNGLLAIYTTEMVLKILGMGFFFGKNAYLKDYWNVLDFIIVTTAYIPLIVTSSSMNLQAIRVLRVLRPLRTISKIKILKVIVLTLLAAIGPLMETVFVLVFMYAIFAIAGLQLFSGVLKKRCFALETGIAPIDPNGDDDINDLIFCSTDNDCEDYGGKLHICGKMVANPVYGITNFDNLPSSLLMVFQIVSTEGWSATMYDVQKTFSPYASVYFLAIVVLCTFFLLNLTLAIIKAEFTSKSTDANKGKLDRKFLSHDVKLAEKLESKKGDVLKLIHRRENGEIEYDKYIFHKENLVALNTKKGHLKGLSRRRRGTLGSLTHKFTEFGSALSRRIKLGERAKEGFLTVISLMKTSHKNAAIHPSPEDFATHTKDAFFGQKTLKDQEDEAVKSNSFIAEANEQSEQSVKTPSEVSTPSLSDAKLARRRTIGMRTSKSPIRPIISQKIQVTPAEQSQGKRALIGMAGIRNREDGKKLKVEKSVSGLDLLSLAEKSERNEISISEDRSFLDRPEGRHFVFYPPNKVENDDVVVSKNLIRKINQIKKIESRINKSRASSNRKKNELLLSIFDLAEEVNYRQHEIEANIPSGILDDSDFFHPFPEVLPIDGTPFDPSQI